MSLDRQVDTVAVDTPARSEGIDRRSGLSNREFIAEYLLPLRPVIMIDAIRHWKALGTWTPEMFQERYGTREVGVDGRPYVLDHLIDQIKASTRERPAPYLRNLLIEDWMPELLGDVLPLPHCAAPNWLDSWLFPSRQSLTSLELYIGGCGASFPVLHYDNLHTHAFLMQLYGRKQFIVFSPDQTRYLYPGSRRVSSSMVNDMEHPDLVRFPLFAKAKRTVFVLEPGETLFVPSGWWHTTRMLDTCITVSANTANAANWKAFSREFVDLKGHYRSAKYAAVLAVYLQAMHVVQPLLDMWQGV